MSDERLPSVDHDTFKDAQQQEKTAFERHQRHHQEIEYEIVDAYYEPERESLQSEIGDLEAKQDKRGAAGILYRATLGQIDKKSIQSKQARIAEIDAATQERRAALDYYQSLEKEHFDLKQNDDLERFDFAMLDQNSEYPRQLSRPTLKIHAPNGPDAVNSKGRSR